MSYNAMPWEVEFEDAFEPEFEELSEAVQDKAYAMFKVLSEFGPTTGLTACLFRRIPFHGCHVPFDWRDAPK